MAKKPAESSADAPATFEQALTRLETIVHDLEDGRIGLEESLARYEQGVGLLRQCYELLARAERRIELLGGVDADGNAVTSPFEDEQTTLAQKAARRSRRRSTPGRPPKVGGDDSVNGGDDMDERGQLF